MKTSRTTPSDTTMVTVTNLVSEPPKTPMCTNINSQTYPVLDISPKTDLLVQQYSLVKCVRKCVRKCLKGRISRNNTRKSCIPDIALKTDLLVCQYSHARCVRKCLKS